MNCDRARERLSELAEGTLAPLLAREISDHLATCASCRKLSGAVTEVIATLGSMSPPSPPAALTERILARTLPSLRSRRTKGADNTSWLPPAASWIAAAAVLAFVLVWRPPQALSELTRETSQTAHQVYSFGVRTYYDTQRWVQELNVLRLTFGVAFEDRIDRLSERLRDLDQARRQRENEEREGSSSSLGRVHDMAARPMYSRSLS